MELIDSHAHIDFPQFAEDREAMLERARAAEVTTLLAIGTGPGPETRFGVTLHGAIRLDLCDRGHSSPRCQGSEAGTPRAAEESCSASQDNRLGRDRAGLFLRSFAA